MMTEATTAMNIPQARPQVSRRRLTIIVSLSLILAAAAASLFLVRGVEGQLRDIAQTFEVRSLARQVLQRLTDAETGQRGYLLTVDPLYLEPYEEAIRGLDETYSGLMAQIGDSPGQMSRIEGIQTAITQKRDEMARTIELASNGQLEEALAILRSDEGRVVMEGLRASISDFITTENTTLEARNREIEGYRTALITAILAALGGAATLAYVLFNRTQSQVTKLARSQSALRVHNEELEMRVRERTAELEDARAHAERERERVEALLQDTNHRIGNSLATVSSLLGLQVNRTRSDEVRQALEAARGRVHAIASGHRRLRLGADLETTRADEFLEAVIEDLKLGQVGSGRIAIEGEFDPVVIMARDATTVGIVLGELVTNAVKHAFSGDRTGTVRARLKIEGDDGAVLSVEDDGLGLSKEPSAEDAGLGTLIIRQLATQFGGTPTYSPRLGGGTVVRVAMPSLAVPPAAS